MKSVFLFFALAFLLACGSGKPADDSKAPPPAPPRAPEEPVDSGEAATTAAAADTAIGDKKAKPHPSAGTDLKRPSRGETPARAEAPGNPISALASPDSQATAVCDCGGELIRRQGPNYAAAQAAVMLACAGHVKNCREE